MLEQFHGYYAPLFYRDVQLLFDGKAVWNSVPPVAPTMELLQFER
jgi:hypothetical protein